MSASAFRRHLEHRLPRPRRDPRTRQTTARPSVSICGVLHEATCFAIRADSVSDSRALLEVDEQFECSLLRIGEFRSLRVVQNLPSRECDKPAAVSRWNRELIRYP